MSCDDSIHYTAVDLDPWLSANLDLGDYFTATEPDVKRRKPLKRDGLGLNADQSRSKGHRLDVQSRAIPDTTQIEPEYVWGDEGPIND